MSHAEALKLAPLIGIDASSLKSEDYLSHIWFFQTALTSKLPLGFIREKAPGGEYIYYNEITGEVKQEHPNAKVLRKNFMKVLKGQISAKEFESKGWKRGEGGRFGLV